MSKCGYLKLIRYYQVENIIKIKYNILGPNVDAQNWSVTQAQRKSVGPSEPMNSRISIHI